MAGVKLWGRDNELDGGEGDTEIAREMHQMDIGGRLENFGLFVNWRSSKWLLRNKDEKEGTEIHRKTRGRKGRQV